MNITHRQIEVFRAVMVGGHVTRAAEALHTSQPTVSRELARFEQVTGLHLFDRIKGRLRPTPRALALLAEVELSYAGLDRIAATALALREFSQGRLQVAGLPAFGQALLPQAVRHFAQRQPQAGVSITPLESPALELALTEQRFDLGLTEQREAPAACELQRLLTADEVCVLPAAHPLAHRRRLIPADFEGQPFISLAAHDPYRQQVDAVFGQAGVERRLLWETPSAASVCAMVRQGLGLALVNPLTALEFAGDGLAIRPFSVPIAFEVALVLPRWRSEHPLRQDLVLALERAAAEAVERISAIASAGPMPP
ncbi:LysR family transcriptional regulator [Ideonella sp.]|uniref:LysR family transcriptional regulator n=1 Tax=Ideonella sp. TaxID=1929293 RepID=UPI003BB6DED2